MCIYIETEIHVGQKYGWDISAMWKVRLQPNKKIIPIKGIDCQPAKLLQTIGMYMGHNDNKDTSSS